MLRSILVTVVILATLCQLVTSIGKCDFEKLKACSDRQPETKPTYFYAFRATEATRDIESRNNFNIIKYGNTETDVRSRYKEEYTKCLSKCLVDLNYISLDPTQTTKATATESMQSINNPDHKAQLRKCVEQQWEHLSTIACYTTTKCLDARFACVIEKNLINNLEITRWPFEQLQKKVHGLQLQYTNMRSQVGFIASTEWYMYAPKEGYIQDSKTLKDHVEKTLTNIFAMNLLVDHLTTLPGYKCVDVVRDVDIFRA